MLLSVLLTANATQTTDAVSSKTPIEVIIGFLALVVACLVTPLINKSKANIAKAKETSIGKIIFSYIDYQKLVDFGGTLTQDALKEAYESFDSADEYICHLINKIGKAIFKQAQDNGLFKDVNYDTISTILEPHLKSLLAASVKLIEEYFDKQTSELIDKANQ